MNLTLKNQPDYKSFLKTLEWQIKITPKASRMQLYNSHIDPSKQYDNSKQEHNTLLQLLKRSISDSGYAIIMVLKSTNIYSDSLKNQNGYFVAALIFGTLADLLLLTPLIPKQHSYMLAPIILSYINKLCNLDDEPLEPVPIAA